MYIENNEKVAPKKKFEHIIRICYKITLGLKSLVFLPLKAFPKNMGLSGKTAILGLNMKTLLSDL